MAIRLSPYSPIRAPQQAYDLHSFARSQDQAWLNEFHPRFAQRNRDLGHSLYNVIRLWNLTRRVNERFSFVVLDRTPGERVHVLGAASIILDGEIRNPENNAEIIRAHDIDYVARSDTQLSTHIAIGHALVERTSQIVYARSAARSGDTVPTLDTGRLMATINAGDQHPSVGLRLIPGMIAIGEPGVLETADGEDYHQLAKGNSNRLQLYALPAAA